MIRLAGIACILAGSTGLGIVFARELDQRIQELEALRQLMLRLRGEIWYMHCPLPEAFLHLSENAPSPFAEFFRGVSEGLLRRDGESAEEIWCRNQKECLGNLHLGRQEQQELKSLGSLLGYLDVETQINGLDYYLEQLKLSEQYAREAASDRRRLYQYMGILGGIGIVILIF